MRLIHFATDVTESTVEDLVTALRSPNAPRTVLIDSKGGHFMFFSTLGPAILRRGITTVSGDVRSSAISLYLHGQRRLAYPDAQFRFHEVHFDVPGWGLATLTDIEREEEDFLRLQGKAREEAEEFVHGLRVAQSWLMNFMSERTGARPHVFEDLMRRNAMVNAREAVRLGLVHEIISPPQR